MAYTVLGSAVVDSYKNLNSGNLGSQIAPAIVSS